MNKKSVNPKFRILSALGILFVVAGHADFGVFDIAGLFPYYSFHIGIFAFVSGYFYRDEEENDIGGYIRKKVKHLLLPYFVWNLFYGLFVTLLRIKGFSIGSKMSIQTLVLEPFLGGHQFGLNFSSWFVPVLFLIELVNIIGRKAISYLKLKNELLIFSLTLLAGGMTVLLSQRGSVWGYYRHPGCFLFLLPIFQAGIFYRKILEEKTERISPGICILGAAILQYPVLWYSKGQVAYSAVWCSGFLHGPFIPYLTTFLGISFWLGIARVLTPLWKEGNLLDQIGRNTFSIMMHHVTGFFFLNLFYYILSKGELLIGFDTGKFFAGYEYRYLILGMENSKWIYLFAGIVFSLLVSWVIKKIRIFLLASR